jgi:hypothetical protein
LITRDEQRYLNQLIDEFERFDYILNPVRFGNSEPTMHRWFYYLLNVHGITISEEPDGTEFFIFETEEHADKFYLAVEQQKMWRVLTT